MKSLCRQVGLRAPSNSTVMPVVRELTSTTMPTRFARSGHRAAPSLLILKRVPTTILSVLWSINGYSISRKKTSSIKQTVKSQGSHYSGSILQIISGVSRTLQTEVSLIIAAQHRSSLMSTRPRAGRRASQQITPPLPASGQSSRKICCNS